MNNNDSWTRATRPGERGPNALPKKLRFGGPWGIITLAMLLGSALTVPLSDGGQFQKDHLRFAGEAFAGKVFEQAFGPGFLFRLEPQPYGWTVVIRDQRGTEDISRLTPPFHFVPNPRDVEGWHSRNVDNSGPNEPGEKNVNAPGLLREFIFSPAVGQTIGSPNAQRKPTPEDIEAIRSFGEGKLLILNYGLTSLEPGKRARFEWMRFQVELSWSAFPKP